MLNERPEGKDKFGYVLIGLLVAFVIILVTSAVIWNSLSVICVAKISADAHPRSCRKIEPRPRGCRATGMSRGGYLWTATKSVSLDPMESY